MLCRYDRQKGKLMNQNNKFKGVFIYLAVIVLLVIGMVAYDILKGDKRI